jgi:hypothetical protein
MKNTIRLLGIIALAAIIGFAMTACPTDDGGDGDDGGSPGGGPSASGDKLELFGQVWETSYRGYSKYTDSLNFTSAVPGTGTITNGQLSYTIETPNNTLLEPLYSFIHFDRVWDNIQPSTTTVKAYQLNLFVNYSDYDGIYRGNSTDNSYSQVLYVYVESDLIITGTGETEYEDGYTFKLTPLNLALKQGWNALYLKESLSGNTITQSLSLNNPNLRWILGYYRELGEDDDYYSITPPQQQRSLSDTPAIGNFKSKAFNRLLQRSGN